VLAATMLVAASLQAWDRDRGWYRPLARTCAAVAVACLGLGAARRRHFSSPARSFACSASPADLLSRAA
jgi:hypothetical protein